MFPQKPLSKSFHPSSLLGGYLETVHSSLHSHCNLIIMIMNGAIADTFDMQLEDNDMKDAVGFGIYSIGTLTFTCTLNDIRSRTVLCFIRIAKMIYVCWSRSQLPEWVWPRSSRHISFKLRCCERAAYLEVLHRLLSCGTS